jgi:hypothetical protein
MDTSISIWDHLPNLKYQKIDFFLMISTCIICYFASNHSSIFAQPVNACVFLRNLPNQKFISFIYIYDSYDFNLYHIICYFASNHSSIFAQPVDAHVFLSNLPNQNLYPLSTYRIQRKFPQPVYKQSKGICDGPGVFSNVTKSAIKLQHIPWGGYW